MQGVCQILNTELPEFSPTFLVSLDSASTFFHFFCSIYPPSPKYLKSTGILILILKVAALKTYLELHLSFLTFRGKTEFPDTLTNSIGIICGLYL